MPLAISENFLNAKIALNCDKALLLTEETVSE